jgi:hypothetical protein
MTKREPRAGRVGRLALLVLLAAAILAAAAAAVPGVAGARAPLVRHMVVFRSGEAVTKRIRARRTRVRVRGRRSRCAVARGTPLAALVRSRTARLRVRDFGACSRRRASDGGGLFVSGIGPDRNSGRDGWVYKVGRRLGTAGAADPTGPFGRGLLRSGSRVVWFYCFLRGTSCQRTLAVRGRSLGGGDVRVLAASYDDEGQRRTAAGATVTLGGATALTDANGLALFQNVPAGRFRLRAERAGLVRSFSEWVVVR